MHNADQATKETYNYWIVEIPKLRSQTFPLKFEFPVYYILEHLTVNC